MQEKENNNELEKVLQGVLGFRGRDYSFQSISRSLSLKLQEQSQTPWSSRARWSYRPCMRHSIVTEYVLVTKNGVIL